MEAVISRGNQEIKLSYREDAWKEMAVDLIIILFGRDPFITAATAKDKLETMIDMFSEFMADSKNTIKQKEWLSIKRKFVGYQKLFSKMEETAPAQRIIWDFISSMDGNPNLPGFGFCMSRFGDRCPGNSERTSIWEMDRKSPL